MGKWSDPILVTLSKRIDTSTRRRLDALSKCSKRSKSFLAAEAYVEAEESQLGEIQAGIAELGSEEESERRKGLEMAGFPGASR